MDDIEGLKEAVDIEFKLANGKYGEGAIPKNFWETYSAMANSEGGEIIL